jgi:hypothetical protein
MKDEDRRVENKPVIVVGGKVYAGRVPFLPDEFRMTRTLNAQLPSIEYFATDVHTFLCVDTLHLERCWIL